MTDLLARRRSVALSGRARAGKDTVADALVRDLGYTKTSLAAPIKELAARELGWDGAKDERGRRLLQLLGTEVGRAYREDVWVDKLVATPFFSGEHWVVSDCRFPNEVAALLRLGFVAVRVVRPSLDAASTPPSWWRRLASKFGFGPALQPAWRLHPSETALDDYPFDLVLTNDLPLLDFQAHARAQLEPIAALSDLDLEELRYYSRRANALIG